MILRKEIEPRMDIAEINYYKVLSVIEKYQHYVDVNGDHDLKEYNKTTDLLCDITGKIIKDYNLYETYEEEGNEVLAFRISLPLPKLIDSLLYDEVFEIVKRIKSYCFIEESKLKNETFSDTFTIYLSDYYHQFLKLNLKYYRFDLFNRQKNGNEYSIEEITKFMMV